MVEKFNDYLIILYPKNKLTTIYKRVIEKIYDDRYTLETYYRVNKIDKCFKSEIIFNKEEIEIIINIFLEEYNLEKTLFYK